jgi:hypothetical protein
VSEPVEDLGYLTGGEGPTVLTCEDPAVVLVARPLPLRVLEEPVGQQGADGPLTDVYTAVLSGPRLRLSLDHLVADLDKLGADDEDAALQFGGRGTAVRPCPALNPIGRLLTC